MSALILAEPRGAAPALALRFLAWAGKVGAEARADAASLVARAALHAELPPAGREELLVVMTALTDDSDPRVRRALAEAVAGEPGAPRTLIVALVNDVSAV